MAVPAEYRYASRDFAAFMDDLKQTSMLQTEHQAYTMLDGVFRTFRRRLSVADALVFADVLPAVLRAIFVSGWDPEEPRRPFSALAEMNREVKSLRHNHNVSTDSAIEDVAAALRRHVNTEMFDRVLARLPEPARRFWWAV